MVLKVWNARGGVVLFTLVFVSFLETLEFEVRGLVILMEYLVRNKMMLPTKGASINYIKH